MLGVARGKGAVGHKALVVRAPLHKASVVAGALLEVVRVQKNDDYLALA
jgi:hypothetical protein